MLLVEVELFNVDRRTDMKLTVELFNVDRRTDMKLTVELFNVDRRTDMKLTVALRNFANVPKNTIVFNYKTNIRYTYCLLYTITNYSRLLPSIVGYYQIL